MSARFRVNVRQERGGYVWTFRAGPAEISAANPLDSEREAVRVGVQYREAFVKAMREALRRGCQEASVCGGGE